MDAEIKRKFSKALRRFAEKIECGYCDRFSEDDYKILISSLQGLLEIEKKYGNDINDMDNRNTRQRWRFILNYNLFLNKKSQQKNKK